MRFWFVFHQHITHIDPHLFYIFLFLCHTKYIYIYIYQTEIRDRIHIFIWNNTTRRTKSLSRTMKILDISIASFIPVLKVLLLTVLGLFLALERVDILGAEARKHLNNVGFITVFILGLLAPPNQAHKLFLWKHYKI